MLTYIAIKHFREVRGKGKFSVQLVGLTTVCVLGFLGVWGFLHYYFNHYIPNDAELMAMQPTPPFIEHLDTAFYAAMFTNYMGWLLLFIMNTDSWLKRWYARTELDA